MAAGAKGAAPANRDGGGADDQPLPILVITDMDGGK
ncbi:hypothetical protein SAMN06265338_101740 [Rhodoblastus acidophilus]|uniref:Uncharacterized protein n=1 Tax=Rhodoblastus acidophilus TaxID=1074 RepID=A0A212QLA0_RHOAC|nr:hypothetical protein SAMN06265338_101740 [Rhodoblastus acidophilus]